MRPIMWFCALMVGAAACGGRPPRAAESDVVQLRQAVAKRDTVTRQLAQSIAYIGAPLRTLNDSQRAAVAGLLVLARATAGAELAPKSSRQAFDSVWTSIEDICPPLKAVSFSRGGCLDAEIAYASAMAKCHNEGKSDSQCERETAPEAAAAVACEMKALQQLQGILARIPGRRWPPGPFPWPITGTPPRPAS